MAYRNGTYIAFHAEGKTEPTASDIKYYRMIKAWHEHDDVEFRFVNSHDKTSAVRDNSLRETLRRSLIERLRNSKNFLIVIGPTTKNDIDWVPFEIEQAIDNFGLPVIAVYTGYDSIFKPGSLFNLWPVALQRRILSQSAKVIHIPFKRVLIDKAIGLYDLNLMPPGSLAYFTEATYRAAGLLK